MRTVGQTMHAPLTAPPHTYAVTTLPPLARIRQKLSPQHLEDVPGAIRAGIAALGDIPQIKPGAKIAITGGSRGIADIAPILRTVVEELKARGAEPFLIPAMGSHGGATAEGQIEMMAGYGMTEEALGCPVCATMEVVELGTTARGITVFYDRMASEADGVIVVNRV
ncbi:MAG TPA: lactate racemase domain-containing protein, partial [Thermomicrobiales bacterium]